MSIPTPGRRLRDAFKRQPIAVPGVFNALVAKIAERLGHDAVYLSGGALSAASARVRTLTRTERHAPICSKFAKVRTNYSRNEVAVDGRSQTPVDPPRVLSLRIGHRSETVD